MSVKLFLVVAIVAIFVTVNSAQSSPQQSSSHNVKESNGNTRKMRLLTMNPGIVRFYRMMGGSGGVSKKKTIFETFCEKQKNEFHIQKN